MSEIATALPTSEIAAVPPTEPVQGDSGAPELQMRRRAAAVLEVLGGAKSPAEAADGLGIALPSYYLLEARALEGLVSAGVPSPRGRSAGGDGKPFPALKRVNERLRQDLTRTQALTRAVQRAVGMQTKAEATTAISPARRRRRATARALRAARELVPQDCSRPSLPTSPLDVEPQP